jgi:hypothetical protein
MINFILSDINFPYSTALGIVITFVLLELMTVIIGFSIASFLDNLITPSHSADLEVGADSTLITSWLFINKLPITIWASILLTGIGLSGITMNFITVKYLSFALPHYISIPLALIFSIPFTRKTSKVVSKLMPKNESSAVCITTLKGRIGTVTVGTGTISNPVEAKVIDAHDKPHYVLVRPTNDITITQNDEVVLFEQVDGIWLCDKFTHNLKTHP